MSSPDEIRRALEGIPRVPRYDLVVVGGPAGEDPDGLVEQLEALGMRVQRSELVPAGQAVAMDTRRLLPGGWPPVIYEGPPLLVASLDGPEEGTAEEEATAGPSHGADAQER